MPVGLVLVCFIWTLDTVYASETNTKIPLVAARVYTGLEASLIHNVHVSFVLAATSSNYVYFSGGAAITYIASGVEVSQDYSMDVYMFAISNSSFIMSSNMAMFPYEKGPGIVAVGLYGDYAVARYREVQCTVAPDIAYCTPTDYYAVLYVMRPNVTQPESYGDVLSLDSCVGDMFNLITQVPWDSRTKYGGTYVYVSSLMTVSETGSIDIFSMSVPLIRPPPGEQVKDNFIYKLAAGVGVSKQINAVGRASATLKTNDPKYFIYAVYYLPPVKFEYQGNYYPLPSLFVDFRVGVSTLDRGAEGTT